MTGELLAWNPVTQKEAWHAKSPVVETVGVLATGDNLIFQGRADGMLVAYRANDGKMLWQFDAGTGIMAPPVTFAVNGVQYVTVMAGWGGGSGLFNPPGSGPVKPGYGRILTFALGGQAKLSAPSFGPQGPPPMPELTYDSSPELVHRAFYHLQLALHVVPWLKCGGRVAPGSPLLPQEDDRVAGSDRVGWRARTSGYAVVQEDTQCAGCEGATGLHCLSCPGIRDRFTGQAETITARHRRTLEMSDRIRSKSPGQGFSRRELLVGGAALATTLASSPAHAFGAFAQAKRSSFKPGEEWFDTSGKLIQAHGGSIIKVGDLFYWYGENKEFTTGKNDIWTWGVRCYRSADLYNWEDIGLIISPDTKDPQSPLSPQRFLDRPHILYNPRTKKFVCWIKLMSKGSEQTRTVLVADKLTGPYKILRSELHPVGMNAGDYDLVASPDDGKAYMYFERVHTELICADLTEAYTDFTGYYSTHFPEPGPPDTREGIAYFRRGTKHYLITSGTTGYFPNPCRAAIAETFHGPFTDLGETSPTDRSRTTFNSQPASVFKHPKKKDLYIMLGDRWLGPMSGERFESGQTSKAVQSIFRKMFTTPRPPLTEEEAAIAKEAVPPTADTSVARYVWLPIRFEGDRPFVDWRCEWSLDEFEDV